MAYTAQSIARTVKMISYGRIPYILFSVSDTEIKPRQQMFGYEIETWARRLTFTVTQGRNLPTISEVYSDTRVINKIRLETMTRSRRRD